jgi:hypothetical protein
MNFRETDNEDMNACGWFRTNQSVGFFGDGDEHLCSATEWNFLNILQSNDR